MAHAKGEVKPVGQQDARTRLRDLWAESLAKGIESMSGVRPSFAWSADAGQSDSSILWWEQGFNIQPHPLAWAGAPEKTWAEVGRRALEAAGLEEVQPEDAKGTWTELLSQAFSGLAQELTSRAGEEISAQAGKLAGEPPPYSPLQSGALSLAESGPLPLLLFFHDSLIAACQAGENPPQEPQEPVVRAFPEAPELSYKTLDLLKDVELPVSVSFGRTEMALQDVLKLTAGSVIELDRLVDEPVELIVNDTVVALGEVVVIEGNYGLRIQRIMSREDLLRTSGVR